jgi:hypothetical protein
MFVGVEFLIAVVVNISILWFIIVCSLLNQLTVWQALDKLFRALFDFELLTLVAMKRPGF